VADLNAKGIQNAAALLGGFMAWQNAGLPVESTQTVSKQTPVPAPSQAPKQSPK
jgi:3-mercaptopyruvate sulfurtransferase SseA